MFASQIQTGEPITVGEVRLAPVARSMRLELGWGVVAWNRAVGVSVRSGDGETMVPIRDRTRRLQLAILGAGLLGSLLLRVSGRRRRRRDSRE